MSREIATKLRPKKNHILIPDKKSGEGERKVREEEKKNGKKKKSKKEKKKREKKKEKRMVKKEKGRGGWVPHETGPKKCFFTSELSREIVTKLRPKRITF